MSAGSHPDMGTASAASGRLWALFPVLLLSATAVAMVVVVSLALDDKGFSVERDYYKKAVAFDAELQQRKRNDELGWRLAVEPIVNGDAVIRVSLLDRERRPIAGASISGEAFAVARSQRQEQLAFTESQAGAYEARLSSRRSGLWELRLTAILGSDRFTKVIRTELAPP